MRGQINSAALLLVRNYGAAGLTSEAAALQQSLMRQYNVPPAVFGGVPPGAKQ